MARIYKTLVPLILVPLILIAGFTSTPAWCQMTNDQLRATISNLCGTVESWQEFDDQLAKVKKQVDQKTASGVLSPIAVSDLQSRLSRLQQLEAQDKQLHHRHPTLSQALRLTKDLNRLIARLRDDEIKVSTAEEVAQIRIELSKEIESAVNAVLMTQADAAKLLSDLNLIGNEERTLHGNSKQIQSIALSLQWMKAQIAQTLKLAQSAITDLNRREADLEMRIDTAMRTEAITSGDAAHMRHRLDQITQAQSEYVNANTSGPLSGSQIVALAGDLDQLQALIDKQRKPGPTAPAASQQSPR